MDSLIKASETTVIITRHGETEWNISRRHQGHLDSPLTQRGIAQAESFAAAIADFPVDAIFCSDLGRAMSTARIISNRTGFGPVIPDPRLREINCGMIQGYTDQGFQAEFPDLYRLFFGDDPDYRLPEGESLRQFQERTVTVLNEISRQHPGQTVLVVAHAGNLGCIFREVFAIPLTAPRRFSIMNVSFNRFTVTDGIWQLETWGDIRHLQGNGKTHSRLSLKWSTAMDSPPLEKTP